MSRNEINVFAPATVANVACGFDIFGFALDMPGDELFVKLTDSGTVVLKSIEGDGGLLPKDPYKNTSTAAVIAMLDNLSLKQGVEITLHKKMPLRSGLGSSAASAAGSLFAVNELLDHPFQPKDLIPFAMEGERIACGSAHADNVAPALLGGFVLVRSYSPLDIVKVPVALELFCTILHPKIEIDTQYARSILCPVLSLKQHVAQTGNAAGLVLGLMQGDALLIQRSLQDLIIEPMRASLLPGFAEIKASALEAGALGCSFSGSGPSLFALSLTKVLAEKVGVAMTERCHYHKMESELFISKINNQGPRLW